LHDAGSNNVAEERPLLECFRHVAVVDEEQTENVREDGLADCWCCFVGNLLSGLSWLNKQT